MHHLTEMEKKERNIDVREKDCEKIKGNSFLENVLGSLYISRKSDAMYRSQLTNLVVDELNAKRTLKSDKTKEGNKGALIMKSGNSSFTAAILGRRNAPFASTILRVDFDPDMTFENGEDTPSPADIHEIYDANGLMNNNIGRQKITHFNFDDIKTLSEIKEGKMDIVGLPPIQELPKMPAIEVFLDELNSAPWVIDKKLPKMRDESGKDEMERQRKISGIYCDDLLMDRMYRNMNKK